ncbi:MAG: peptide chain release factor N(5)-glutamine methyltransferase [Acidobacteriaceae bacterium]
MTLREALAEASISIPRREADTLLAHLLFRDRAWLIAHAGSEISSTLLHSYRSLVTRRAAGEPIQYLTGVQEFYGFNLRVTRDTLIPRPETELLVEAVLKWIASQPELRSAGQPLRILDVGTGTGAIAIALAAHLPGANVTATDLYPNPLSIAEHNAGRLGLADRILFLQSDLLGAAHFASAPPFDVIVSNPPYVSLYEAATMPDEVLKHEPHTALFGGPSGLEIYRRLIPAAHKALRSGGLLALEIGYGQRDSIRRLLEKPANGIWTDYRFENDYAQIPRMALATRA